MSFIRISNGQNYDEIGMKQNNGKIVAQSANYAFITITIFSVNTKMIKYGIHKRS